MSSSFKNSLNLEKHSLNGENYIIQRKNYCVPTIEVVIILIRKLQINNNQIFITCLHNVICFRCHYEKRLLIYYHMTRIMRTIIANRKYLPQLKYKNVSVFIAVLK